MCARVRAERAEIDLLDGRLPLDAAAAAYAEALTTLRAEQDERGLGRAELLAGSVHWFACNLEAAGESAQRAAKHYAAAGFSPAGCINVQAEALYYGATPVEDGTATCIGLLDQSPDRGTEANVTSVLGGLHALAGRPADARSLLDHARELYEDTGNTRALLTVWTPLRIDAELFAGDLDGATTLARESLAAVSSLEQAHAGARSVELAELLLLKGEESEAERVTAFAEANALPSDVLVQFLSRSLRARLLARAGNMEDALDAARDAVALASLTDVLRYRARAHVALAEVLELAGQGSEARAQERAAESLLRQKGVKGTAEFPSRDPRAGSASPA